MKVGLAQIDIIFGQPDKNIAKVKEFVEKAASEHCDVVVFPEMWNTGYALTDLEQLADDGESIKNILSSLAKYFAINIVAGSIAVKEGDKFFNRAYVFDRTGQLLSQYDKVHLFGLMNEEKFIAAGSKKHIYELAGIESAGVICYDIRFPEWLRTNMASQEAKVLYVVAEWPDPRTPQWQALLVARAIENQAFVVAVNRVGEDPDNRYLGNSLVIDPLGNIIVNAGESENLSTVSIDLSEIDSIRGQIPVFEDRRPDLYE